MSQRVRNLPGVSVKLYLSSVSASNEDKSDCFDQELFLNEMNMRLAMLRGLMEDQKPLPEKAAKLKSCNYAMNAS